MTATAARAVLLAALAAMLLLCAWAYHPGLAGGFHFDDFANLDVLGDTRPGWRSLLLYLSSGTADPLGRPVALLSFLGDAGGWPADPARFLRSNLAIHLANGVLLFALLRQLGTALATAPARRDAAALLGAALWLLHPLLVSTTLYAVQREAMLPATFVLAGLLCHGHGRRRFLDGACARGLAWMVGGVVAGTALAALSKANGLLLPLLALVLEGTIYAASDRRDAVPAADALVLRRMRIVVLWLPSLLVLAYIGHYLFELHETLGRPWTVGQRLLSEPRALLDYLGLLLVPRSVTGGLYNDDFLPSTGMLQPWTTLPSIVLVFALLATGYALRRRAPAWSAAIAFYFGAQLLESSAVPLELYFEHRNYLPALLLFWPLARLLCAWRVRVPLRAAIAASLLLLFATITYERSSLWGQPERLSSLWLVDHPGSPRALATVAIALREHGQPKRAALLLGRAWEQAPADAQLAINMAAAACEWRGLRAVDLRLVGRTLRIAGEGDSVAYRWLDEAVDRVREGRCPGLDHAGIESLAEAIEANPRFDPTVRTQNLESLRGRIALEQQQGALAAAHFRRSLAADIRPEVAASQAWMLGSAGYHREAMAYLDEYDRIAAQAREPAPGMPRVHRWLQERFGYWPGEFAAIRAAVQSAEAQSPQAPPTGAQAHGG
jgi:hypothetical protein